MAGAEKPNLVVVQNALANGPVTTEALLATVYQTGLRWIDPGALWEACATHGLAERRHVDAKRMGAGAGRNR